MKNKILVMVLLATSLPLAAQKYNSVVDKTVAVVGNEVLTLSDIESEVRVQAAEGRTQNLNARCEMLETLLEDRIFLMQARLDSLEINNEIVLSNLNQRIDQIRHVLGGDEEVEAYFGKPMYRIREEWMKKFQEQSLSQQEKSEIARAVPELTPYDVKSYLDTVDKEDLPVVPIRYQLSQICVYPDRESANFAVRERLLELRERIINGEKFTTLARLYSEDPGSASRGGELGMAPKSTFWPVFSDAAMALKPGVISQIVETPDGFHIIEVIEKKGDMFNARHILIKPKYTSEDREKAFHKLDSLRTEILEEKVSFSLAAMFYSEDPSTRTNGGQMADPYTGSSYFEIDQLKPQDYAAIKDLKEGEISEPVESLDNEGRAGNLVYKVIRVDKIIPAHPASFENDYDQIISDVFYKKQLEAIDDFLNEKIAQAHIVIDPMYKDCDFRRPIWKDKIRK